MFDYAGSVHFHSEHSFDAREPVEKIVQAAQRAKLDFAVLTDHFRLDATKEGVERYHDDLLFLVAEEISPRYDHYLAFNLRQPIIQEKIHPNPQALIDEVNAKGGFGFIAHPDHEGAPLVHLRAYPWTDWGVRGYAGISIWSLLGDWASAIRSYAALVKAALFPALVLRGPKPETLSRWDALCRQSHCAAIGETDNHASRRSFFGLPMRFFPFLFAFRTIRTHVVLASPLVRDIARDRTAIFDALRQGQSYISLDLWRDPKGFSFEMFDGEHRATMGGEFTLRGPALVEVKIPARGRIRMIRNGDVIYDDNVRPHFQRDIDRPGVYRIEVLQRVWGRWRPWIYSNPIWVKG